MVATGDEPTANAYIATMRVMCLWARNANLGLPAHGGADAGELLQKFRAHVGSTSFAGLNAEPALHAFRADFVTLAPVRNGSASVINPFGFTDEEVAAIDAVSYGSTALDYAEDNWHELTEWLSRDQIRQVLSRERGKTGLMALQDVGAESMLPRGQGGLGLSVQDIVDVVWDSGGSMALESLALIGPALVRPVEEGGSGLSKEQVLLVAQKGGKSALEALLNVSATLRAMGMTIDEMAAIGASGATGPTLVAIAKRWPDFCRGQVRIEDLFVAGMKHRNRLAGVKNLGKVA